MVNQWMIISKFGLLYNHLLFIDFNKLASFSFNFNSSSFSTFNNLDILVNSFYDFVLFLLILLKLNKYDIKYYIWVL